MTVRTVGHAFVSMVFMLLFPVLVHSQITTPSIREKEVRGAIEEYVKQKTANLGCEVSIKRLSIIGSPVLPEGVLDYEVVAPQQWEGWGTASISVVVRKKDRVVRNIPARVEVEALANMVVTVRQINYGSILSHDDLALRKQDIAAVQGRYLMSPDEAVGKKARISFRANVAIKSDQLEKVPVVKTGQLVTIVAENERMRITVTGKAKSAGAVGDTITVQNLNSLKDVPARIIDAGTVVVVF